MEGNHEDLTENRELSAFLAILALFAVLVALNPSYLSLQTLGMIFASSQILILLAIGAALVMLTRNIDVSVGSTVGLSAIAVGVALNSGYSLPVSILFALSIGALAGRSTVFWWWACAFRRLSPPSARWGFIAGRCCSGPAGSG